MDKKFLLNNFLLDLEDIFRKYKIENIKLKIHNNKYRDLLLNKINKSDINTNLLESLIELDYNFKKSQIINNQTLKFKLNFMYLLKRSLNEGIFKEIFLLLEDKLEIKNRDVKYINLLLNSGFKDQDVKKFVKFLYIKEEYLSNLKKINQSNIDYINNFKINNKETNELFRVPPPLPVFNIFYEKEKFRDELDLFIKLFIVDNDLKFIKIKDKNILLLLTKGLKPINFSDDLFELQFNKDTSLKTKNNIKELFKKICSDNVLFNDLLYLSKKDSKYNKDNIYKITVHNFNLFISGYCRDLVYYKREVISKKNKEIKKLNLIKKEKIMIEKNIKIKINSINYRRI